jgi:hypothetical protein
MRVNNCGFRAVWPSASGAALGWLGRPHDQTLVRHVKQLDRSSVLVSELDQGARREELHDCADRAHRLTAARLAQLDDVVEGDAGTA